MTTTGITLNTMPAVFEPTSAHWDPGHCNAARRPISDGALLPDLDSAIRQEDQLYEQNHHFNDALRTAYCISIVALERQVAEDCRKMEKARSLRFSLTCVESIEATMDLQQWIPEERQIVVAGVSAVTSK